MPASGMDRRTFLGRSAAAAGAVALAGAAGTAVSACSSDPGAATSTTSSATSGVPVRGGSLTIGTMAEIDGFSPSQNRWDTNGLLYANTVYDPLMAVAEDGSIQPYLAESLVPNSTFDVWTLALRPGVTFHDGTALTSTVVKNNFAALASSALTGGAVAGIGSIATPDDLTVVFTLDDPATGFAAGLTTQAGYVVAQATLDQSAGSAPASSVTPVGTGPFVYSAWQPNSHFTATRNPDYWQRGLPYLDQVTYRPIVDTTQREDSLKTGAVDALISIDAQTYEHFRDEPGYESLFETSPVIGSPTMGFMLLNCVRPPTDDLRIRQALARATDQVAIQKVFGDGSVQVIDGLFLPGSPYYSRTGYPAHDPAGAKSLVAEYAAQHGAPSIQISSTPDPRTIQLVQVVQQMWQQAGVHVSITVVQQADVIIDLLTGAFQAVPSAQFGAVDPDLNYPWLSSTTVQPIGTVGLNFARNDDPVIEAALVSARGTLDQATRVDAYRTVDERLAVDLPYAWIGRDIFPFAAVDRVQGIRTLTLPGGRAGYAYNEGVFFPAHLWLASRT